LLKKRKKDDIEKNRRNNERAKSKMALGKSRKREE
jgi:hypothetical protein